jgi:hypothetical protein
MTIAAQLAQTPGMLDLPVYNGTGSTISANLAVAVSATGVIAVGNPTGAYIPVKLPAALGDPVFGVTLADIPDGKVGLVRCIGLTKCVADQAITAGVTVDATTAGKAKSHASGKGTFGIACSTAADGEDVLVLVAPGIAVNA